MIANGAAGDHDVGERDAWKSSGAGADGAPMAAPYEYEERPHLIWFRDRRLILADLNPPED